MFKFLLTSLIFTTLSCQAPPQLENLTVKKKISQIPTTTFDQKQIELEVIRLVERIKSEHSKTN
jgi:hypothetical protein